MEFKSTHSAFPIDARRRDFASLRPIIQGFHLCKRYVRGHSIFHDAMLQVSRGDFVFLTGLSGSGKTTLLRLLMHLEAVTEGQLLVDGRNLKRMNARDVLMHRRKIGMVFQDFKLLANRSVFSNVALPLEMIGKPNSYTRKKVASVLRFVDMESKAKVPCRQLSGGEQQRTALARAVVSEPVLLLADEPTGNLDQAASRKVLQLLQQVHWRGTTVLVATHDRQLPALVPGSRVIRITNRKFREEQSPAAATEPHPSRREGPA